MRHRTAAGRRAHHAKQRARKQRYRAWEEEHAPILDGLGFKTRMLRKLIYLGDRVVARDRHRDCCVAQMLLNQMEYMRRAIGNRS